MLSNFIVSLEAVLPMFLLLAAGLGVKHFRLLTDSELRHLNKMIFIVFFPPMMFANLYGNDIREAVDGKLLIFGVVSVAVIYGVSTLIVLRIEKDPKSRGAMIQAIYRSNFVIMGIPIAVNMYGHGNLAVTAMMVAVIVPIYNVLAVVTLEVFRGGRPDPAGILRKVLTNPLILGAAAGLFFALTGLKLPGVLETAVSDMASVATPLALVILGASIDFKSIRQCGRNLVISVAARLVIVPAAGLTAAALLGFRGIAFVTLIAMFAAPTAVSSFTMAQSMDSDGQLAGNCVIFSTAFACFTMFLWIFLFKNLGMF